MIPVATGDKIKIIHMAGEPQYSNKEGVVTNIDSMDRIRGTWGEYALIPGIDQFVVIEKREE